MGLESPTSHTLGLSVRSFPENKKEQDTMGIKVQFTIQPTATHFHHQASLPWRPVSSNYDHNDHIKPFLPSAAPVTYLVRTRSPQASKSQKAQLKSTFNLFTLEPSTLHSVFQVGVRAAWSVQKHFLLNITLYLAVQINYIPFEIGNPGDWSSIPTIQDEAKKQLLKVVLFISAHKNCTCVPENTLSKIL